ncbi:MAG TPA: SAM-dependent methyltransferase [Streptosporangiaceae bacterium]
MPQVDISQPHWARVYDYWLGGKDNFAADREAAQQVIEAMPGIIPGVRAQRAFLRRAVRYLAAEAGIRQFLDIGTGLPAAGNTHEVAQRIAPESRIVYVDSDPMVLAHARALLTSSKQGACAYMHADLREAKDILAEAERTLDFSQPVAVVLLGVMQFIPDADHPAGLVETLKTAVSPGSHLVLGQPASDVDPVRMADAVTRLTKLTPEPVTMRTRAEILGFFDDLEMVGPGLVQLPAWRPDPAAPPVKGPVPFWCGVGRKA